MFKTVINEYEQKNSYFFKMPNIKETMYEHLHLLFQTPDEGGFTGKSKESEDLFIDAAIKVKSDILAGQKTKSTKNFLIQKVSSNSIIFEKIMEILKIKNGDDPTATQWEEVITKRGNYELAVGYNYKANYIGMKIAMEIRKMTGNYSDEFKTIDLNLGTYNRVKTISTSSYATTFITEKSNPYIDALHKNMMKCGKDIFCSKNGLSERMQQHWWWLNENTFDTKCHPHTRIVEDRKGHLMTSHVDNPRVLANFIINLTDNQSSTEFVDYKDINKVIYIILYNLYY